ncbi:MAG: peptidoglycan-associated lipoprotein Pal [bacterium]
MQTSTRYVSSALIVFVLVFAMGCARGAKKTPGPPGYSVHVEKGRAGYPPPTETVIEEGDIELPPRPSGDLDTPISNMPGAGDYGVVDRIHFDYDKSDIKGEWIAGLKNNARWMRDHAEYDMLIEGHCDERGTNEYNLALGERRAMAARNFLIQEGVDAGRIHVKSWGEEKPIAFGHDESSWFQNRRAEFKVGSSQRP